MTFIRILEEEVLNKKYIAYIIYCLLNRIPILIIGKNPKEIKVDDFLSELSNLIHFREEFIYNTDFIHKSEYENLLENEGLDTNSKRIQIRCPSDSSILALQEFDNFKSWIMGINIDKKNSLSTYIKKFKKEINRFLLIQLDCQNYTVELNNIDLKKEDLKLEESIIKRISIKTDKSITAMKRVLKEKIKLKNSHFLEQDFIQDAFDFNLEEKVLKKNIFKSEIQNFYAASKRAYFILSKLKLLNRLLKNPNNLRQETGMNIGSETLLSTIDYYEASVGRILAFVKNEWGEEFSS
ncbi:MAG: hypothetical protein ACOC4M_15055, partial [Promethearchaeia archaeon]